MKLEIEEFNRGYVVTYTEKDGVSTYVYKNVEYITMIEEVAKRFLKTRIKAVQQ